MEECAKQAGQVDIKTWEALKNGGWPHVCWREAFVLSQMLLCCTEAASGNEADALRRCDKAFILSGPSPLLRDCIELLDSAESGSVAFAAREAHKEPTPSQAPQGGQVPGRSSDLAGGGMERPAALNAGTEGVCVANIAGGYCGLPRPSHHSRPHPSPVMSGREVERRAMPTSDEGLREVYKRSQPLVLEGGMARWRAPAVWSDFNWLREQYGERLVPVELGALHGTERKQWGERLMPLGEFLDTYMIGAAYQPGGEPGGDVDHVLKGESDPGAGEGRDGCKSGGVAYLAQHSLFEQLPRLQERPRLGP